MNIIVEREIDLDREIKKRKTLQHRNWINNLSLERMRELGINIKALSTQRVVCECGREVNKYYLKNHMKSHKITKL